MSWIDKFELLSGRRLEENVTVHVELIGVDVTLVTGMGMAVWLTTRE